jgi:nitroreductase
MIAEEMMKKLITLMVFVVMAGFVFTGCECCKKEEAKMEKSPAVAVDVEKKCAPDTLEIIFERKSVRNYKTDEVSKEHLETIVKAGMAAPTARDRRPWEFIVINDREMLDKLAEALPYAKMAKQASAGIIVAGDLEKQNGGADSPYWIMDCSAAIQNILLAVEHLELGAVWTALYPNQDRIDAVRNLFPEMPQTIVPLAFIPVGVPAGTDKPKDKFNPEQLRWNKW